MAKRLLTSQLVPGLITAEDVYNLNDHLLIPKGTVLTDAIISTFAVHGVFNVLVRVPKKPEAETATQEPAPTTHYERVKASPEFVQFKKDYEAGIQAYKEQVNLVVSKNVPLDVKGLYQCTVALLFDTPLGTNMFDLLQNMRDYDDSTFAHSINVSLICRVMAHWMNLSEAEAELAATCGLLHDIGKLSLPQDLIQKPGKLTPGEFQTIKKHTVYGYQTLLHQNTDHDICEAALMHHERCDGSGYPLKIKGPEINFYAKMVAIADVYDAMTAARVYRGPLCPFKVIEVFAHDGLQKYDPDLLMTFLERVVNSYLSNTCLLSNGQKGNIIYINKHDLAHPVVQCGTSCCDLSQTPGLEIVSLI